MTTLEIDRNYRIGLSVRAPSTTSLGDGKGARKDLKTYTNNMILSSFSGLMWQWEKPEECVLVAFSCTISLVTQWCGSIDKLDRGMRPLGVDMLCLTNKLLVTWTCH